MTHKTRVVLLTLLVLVMAVPAFALGQIAGSSPVDNSLTVTVRIPTRVGIDLSGTDIEFDLSTVTYPPAAFPGYYFPTTPAAGPYVPMNVFCNVAAGWTLTVIADADFDASLPVTQLYYADDGEAITADGAAVGGNWTAFSTTVSGTVAGVAARTNGWANYDQDYQLQITGAEAAMDPSTVVTITYTITSL